MANEEAKTTEQPAPIPLSVNDQDAGLPAGIMPIQIPQAKRQQAQDFFDRAGKAASAGNYDYAIQMNMEGLRLDPDSLPAHQALLEQALRRQAAGGRKAGLMATLKLKFRGKAGTQGPVEEFLQAEEIWTKSPQDLSLADIVLQKMLAAGAVESAKWLAAWLGEFNARTAKDVNRFCMLADVFSQLGQEDKAIDACRAAAAVKPADQQLAERLKNMLAAQAMRKGKYDDQSGFRQSLQDAKTQERLREKESITRRHSAADDQIDEARKQLADNPNEAGKVTALVDALMLKDDAQVDAEAIELLEKAYQQFGAYRFKQRAGEIRIKSNRRLARTLRAKLQAEPDNRQLAEQYRKMLKEHVEVELAHFQESAKNYPTDMRMRYEIGRCLFQLGRFDDAIPPLQEGQRDPKNCLRALSLLGQCFHRKKWYSDAIDVYKRALETPDADAGDMGKELQYNLGLAYEADGQSEQAAKSYAVVAQKDFLYKDVRRRLEHLRKDKQQAPDSP